VVADGRARRAVAGAGPGRRGISLWRAGDLRLDGRHPQP